VCPAAASAWVVGSLKFRPSERLCGLSGIKLSSCAHRALIKFVHFTPRPSLECAVLLKSVSLLCFFWDAYKSIATPTETELCACKSTFILFRFCGIYACFQPQWLRISGVTPPRVAYSDGFTHNRPSFFVGVGLRGVLQGVPGVGGRDGGDGDRPLHGPRGHPRPGPDTHPRFFSAKNAKKTQ